MRTRRVLAAAGVFALTAAGAAQASFTQEPGSPFKVFGGGPYDVLPPVDFNRDGRLDFATINGDSTNVSVLLRQATGGFAPQTGSPFGLGTGAGGGNYGAVADFNGDGRIDIAASTNTGKLSVLLRQASGAFQLEANPPIDVPSASSAAAGDFNGDRRPDLAVTGYGGTLTILLRNNAGSGFAPAATTTVPGGAHRMAVVAELNGDGDPDLAITNDGTHTVTIMRGGTGGTFAPEGTPIAVGNTPTGAVAGDFNRDGRTDLAVANVGSDSVHVLLRTAGGFANAVGSPVPAGDGAVAVATGDFNSDGIPDLVTANQNASNVSILLGRGGARFAPEPGSPIRTDLGASDVVVGDFDADKRPDLAVSNIFGPADQDTVTILLNTTPRPAGPPPPNLDADGDGVQRPTDCDDADPAIRPGASDKPGDKIDQDCNGSDAPFPVLNRSIEAFSATYPTGRYTKFTTMTVKPVRRGDRLRLTCKGPGCEMRKKTIRVRKNARKLSLLRRLKGAQLRKGAVVQLRITRPATIGRVATWRIRAPKIPKVTRSCLRPGAKKPSRCPR